MVISSLQNNDQDRLFYTGKQVTIKYACTLLLCFVVIVADCRFQSMEHMRLAVSFVISPLQYLLDYPVKLVQQVQTLFRTKTDLIDENMQLRYQQVLLEAELQKLITLKHENHQLKQLLSAAHTSQIKSMAAEILAVAASSTRQLLVLNKGSRDGVTVGQPVLDAKGVMGQIIDVGSMTSTVMLISDARCAVPIRDDRTGERGILVGSNDMNHLMLINLPKTSAVAVNDLLVTSGLGRRYPEGYPVGRVEKIVRISGEDFITILVSPVAELNRSRLVLIIWPEQEHELLTEQIHQRLHTLIGEG